MGQPEVDDWGFTDADHKELQALIDKHGDRGRDVMIDLMRHGGVAAAPDDIGGPMRTITLGSDGRARGFPPGGFWRALLDGLRGLDRKGA